MLSTLVRSGRVSGSIRTGLAAVHKRVLQATQGKTWWREILLIGVLYGAYEVSRGFSDVDVPSALKNGREILHLERVWHLAPERVLNAALEHATVFAVIASYFYSLMHYLVTPAVLVWMYRKHRENYSSARTALAISTGLGLVGYLLLPTAPPRMISDSGLRDTLADTQQWGWWGGEGSVPRGLGALTNQFAAMPSLHVGWAIWCGVLIAMYAQRRWVKILGISYPIATTVVVMATGNHYLLDAVAGAVIMGAGALLAVALRHSGRPPAPFTAADADALDVAMTQRHAAPARVAAPATSAARLRCTTDRDTPALGQSDPGLCRPRL
jgi:hypothetical protein